MSMKYLGETLDIHTGGVDLIFPHHEDEIAQSEGATGKPFVRYWLHAQHLQDATGEKMSKRLKNFATVRDLLAEGYTPRAIRYALLTGAHYRSPLAFSEDLLRQAEGAVRRLDEFGVRLNVAEDSRSEPPAEVKRQWDDALLNDLNIQEAVGQLFKFVGELNTRLDSESVSEPERASAYAMLKHANRILDVIDFPARELEETISQLIAERQSARDANDFVRADAIRDRLKAMGIQLYDTKDGVRWKRV
jgi:cysteinyl-tRNA synthetase